MPLVILLKTYLLVYPFRGLHFSPESIIRLQLFIYLSVQPARWTIFNSIAVFHPVPNYKSKSVLGKSKSKSYFDFQYWASLKKSLTSRTSLGQVLDNNCKLIPKSNPTFQKKSIENFECKKILQRSTILALLFRHFPGVLKMMPGAY